MVRFVIHLKLVSMISSLKTGLLPHQQETLDFALKAKFYGDFSIMGSGKSLSLLALICKTGKKAAIVCPSYLVHNWLHEITKHTTLKGTPHFQKWDGSDITVIPYTKIKEAEDTFKNVQIIAADEGQYLKNLEAQRTLAFHNLFYKYTPEYFGYLSGTPIKNRIPEIYSMLLLFSKGPNSPKITEKYRSLYLFCCRFTHVKQTTYGTKFEGMKHVEELRSYINPFSIRHGDEVLNLPSLSRTSAVVSYTENPDLLKEWERFVESGIRTDARSKNAAAIAKASFTASLVTEAIGNGEGPIVVFSDHVKPLELMEMELSKLRVRKIDGGTSPQKRQEYVDMFNNNQLDAILCSIGAASTGYNLTASSLLIFNDPSWTPSDNLQAEKRIHRIGTTKPCRIVRVVGSTPDTYIYEMLEGKMKVINRVINER